MYGSRNGCDVVVVRCCCFFFQAEDGIRDFCLSRGLGDVYKRQNFMNRLEKEDITFIGPSAEPIRVMGDKIESKIFAIDAGINTVPGHQGIIKDINEAVSIANEVGFPVMIKASAGGGGKGMRIAFSEKDVPDAFTSSINEAKSSFGDDRIFIEKFITKPRHIEIQIIADNHGNVIHFGDRECSIQRRNQKIIEESPSPFVDKDLRNSMGNQAVQLAKKVGYSSAGTVEFIVDQDKNFYFLEMNTRLQVEHPVTEAIFGVDLVREQIRVASGLEMSFSQSDLSIDGHAIEVRINAEKLPNFSPCPGKITAYHAPGGLGVRMDSALYAGYSIPPYYDSLIGKLIVHGRDRPEALARLNRALAELIVDGVDSTIPLFEALLNAQEVLSGDYNIHWLEDWLESQDFD